MPHERNHRGAGNMRVVIKKANGDEIGVVDADEVIITPDAERSQASYKGGMWVIRNKEEEKEG